MVRDLIKYIVCNIVQNPDLVTVQQKQDGSKLVVQVLVDSDDLKRVIGKDGCVIKALRGLVHCFDSPEKDVVLDSIA